MFQLGCVATFISFTIVSLEWLACEPIFSIKFNRIIIRFSVNSLQIKLIHCIFYECFPNALQPMLRENGNMFDHTCCSSYFKANHADDPVGLPTSNQIAIWLAIRIKNLLHFFRCGTAHAKRDDDWQSAMGRKYFLKCKDMGIIHLPLV